MSAAIFQPVQVGAITAANRVFMAPLTRCRADAGHVPSEAMVKHYSDRANAGLIIAEATMINDSASAFLNEPGIYNDEQIAAWKKVTDAVHAKGGKIVLQIWHGGRAAAAVNNNGQAPVAPSAIACTHTILKEFNATGEKIPYDTPRALKAEELPAIVELFVQGAKNAISAGFDGVEIHGANGYLLDSFLRDSSNKREDNYGGSIEKRAKFPLEVATAVAKAIGADRTGYRISPLNGFQDMADPEPIEVTSYISAKLSALGLAFLHVMRADMFQQQTGDVLKAARENFPGVIVSNMGYDLEQASSALADKQVDAIAFGTKYVANPDLVERFRVGAELNEIRMHLNYTTDRVEGYNDYPAMSNNKAQ